MSAHYHQLKHQNLSSLIRAEKLSNAQIARKIGVSSKTVQRWINGTSRHIRTELLLALADVLSVKPSQLICSQSDSLRVKPDNQLVKSITSDQYLFRVRANGDWANYLKTLQFIPLEDLSNQQEIQVLKSIGAVYLCTGFLQSAQEHFEKARVKALKLPRQKDFLVEIRCCLAAHDQLNGDLKSALQHLKVAEAKLSDSTPENTRANFHFMKGQILLSSDQFQESELHLRKAIWLAYQNRDEDLLKISIWYPYLGWLYLRQRRHSKAKAAFKRSLELSKRTGWPKGIAISKMAIAAIDAIQQKQPAHQRILGRAKRFHEMIKFRPLESRFQQLQFVYLVSIRDYVRAEKILSERKVCAKASDLYTAHLTLESLLFQKLTQRGKPVSSTAVKKAISIFEKNELTQALKTTLWLQGGSSIDLNEFFQNYFFY